MSSPSDGRSAAERGFPWLLTFAALVVFAALLALGTWQVQRLAWKENLLATIDRRLVLPAEPLDVFLRSGKSALDEEYRPVTVEGVFLHAGERHFFATHEGATGYFVYTPLSRDDGSFVFVNRGFVPFEMKDPATRQQGQVAGRVTVTGLLRSTLAGKPSAIVPDNDPAKNIFYWKDMGEMTATAGLPAGAKVLDLFIDANDAPNPGGFPVGGVTLIDLPNNHLQYAMTWYGLALALAGVYGVWIMRWRRSISDGRS